MGPKTLNIHFFLGNGEDEKNSKCRIKHGIRSDGFGNLAKMGFNDHITVRPIF